MPAAPSLPAAPARHRSPAKPAPRSGFFPEKKSSPPVGGLQHAFFLPAPGLPPSIEGLPPSILLSPQDCLLQSCCHPRIEGNSTRNSTRATPKKWDMPVSSSELHAELHAGQLGKKGTCLFPVPNSTRAATKKWLVPVSSPRHFKSTSATCAFEHHIPARHRRLRYLARHIPAALPARHRSLQPAKPAPRSGFFPGKKCRGCRLSRQPLRFFSSCPVGGQLSKVSANLPGRAAPARRHGGTQLMSRTNYEAVADFAGHWLHRAQVSLLTGEIGQIKLSHIRKKTLARAWCGPGAGLACKVTHGL